MDETYAVQQGVFSPMGRTSPIVVSDGARKSPSSTLTTLTQTLSDLTAIRSLLADAGVLELNIPAGLGMGLDTCYIAPSEVKISRLTDVNYNPMRAVSFNFTVVDRPQGGSQSERTYADVLAAFPTYAAVLAAYPTYAALLAGP